MLHADPVVCWKPAQQTAFSHPVLEALEKQPLAGGWKAANTCYSVVLRIPEAGKDFQENLACLDFSEKCTFLTFVTLKLQLWIYTTLQGVFIAAHPRNICLLRHSYVLACGHYQVALCRVWWGLKVSSWRFQPSVTCPAARLWEDQELLLLYLVVQKEGLEVAAAWCRLLVGWRGKMQEKVSPADGKMRMHILYVWVFLAVELHWIAQKGKAGVGVKGTGTGW